MILRKLLVIIMGIFLIICAGAANIYPLYLKQMREKFGFSLKEVNIYGTFINIGVWIAVPMGWVYDKFGPKISCIIGGTLMSGSYLTLHFLLNSDITSISIFFFLLIALMMGQGSALCYTTSVTTNLKNFRFKKSSAIVGLLVANFALSPSVFTTYRQALNEEGGEFYFLLIAIFILCAVTVCVFVFDNMKTVYHNDSDKKSYEKYKEKKIIKFLIYLNILVLIVYTFGVIFHSIWETEEKTTKFPLVIIYPALQLLNFVVIIMEKYGFFDGVYFKPFINKIIIKQVYGTELVNVVKKEEGKFLDAPEIKKEMELEVKDKLDDIQKNFCIINSLEDNAEDQAGPTPSIKMEKEPEFLEVNLNINDTRNSNVIMNLGVNDDKGESMIDSDTSSDEIIKENSISNKDAVSLKPEENDKMNISFKNAAFSKYIIILFVMFSLGIGSEISNLNNIQFIVSAISKSPPPASQLTLSTKTTETNSTAPNIFPVNNDEIKANSIYSYVILYFVFNSFTRIISGLLLDHLIKIRKLFYYLFGITLLGLISQFLGIFIDKTLLLISVSLGGACHGGYMTFAPVFVRNEYGLTHMGKILGVLTSGNAIGSLIIADLIFILPYNFNLSPNGECYGAKCFRVSYIITTLFFCINLVLSYILLKDYIQKVKDKKVQKC